MAKKNKKNTTGYYVYYDKKTGALLSVTNEESKEYEYGISVEFKEIEKLLTGEQKFNEFVVRDNGNNLELVPVENQGYVFKNNLTEQIVESDADADLVVEWNKNLAQWNFSLSSNYKKNYAGNITATKAIFFVTLENDFDFLIRTIVIDINDLLSSESIAVDFDSKFENDISKISISTRTIFKTYKLKVTHD